MSKPDGGPAFPFTCQGPTTAPETYYGMTLRDYFAAAALTGSVAYNGYGGADIHAEEAYNIADAMLAERDK